MSKPDFPYLRPKQRAMLSVLSDLKEHTFESIAASEDFAGFKRNTVHEVIRLLRGAGFNIVSPKLKMTKPYTFRLASLTPEAPKAITRCDCCGQRVR